MPHATARDGARIHYEIHGECGPTVVLIQGLGLSSRFWFDLPDRLATGPEAWRVVTFDNRGVGRSDRPRGFYGMPAMADDVAAVLDAAGARLAYVVGISLGGMIAQHVALRHPDRVAGLVLLATTPGLPHARLPYARALATLLTLPLGGRLRPRTELAKSFARLVLSKRDAGRASELLARWPAALRDEPTSVAVYAVQLAAALGHSTGFRLGRLACPTVVMTGDDDALMPIQNSQLLARLVPGAHLEVIQGCGHVIHASDPECIRRALHRLRDLGWRSRSADAEGPAAAAPQRLHSGLHAEGARP
ncbi:MAG: alpha/beta hydrolase [Polyangiaceae bacterium]